MELKSKIKKLPETSGVYFFKNKKNQVLYIGKASSLRNRITAYFTNIDHLSPKINKMVQEINDIEYITTSSEIEALLLESKMIKQYNPYYNSQLKDDKSYPYIQITGGDDFPQILFHRKLKQEEKDNQSLYYGPFVDADATRKAIKILRKIFKVRGCSKSRFNQGKVCLDYQIDLCSAPCVGLIGVQEYHKKVKEICLFLEGRQKKLLSQLYREMKKESLNLNFEKAAKIRDEIKSIEEILTVPHQDFLPWNFPGGYGVKRLREEEEKEIKEGEEALGDLKKRLNLDKLPIRIEAFDISNIQGNLAVGSLIVFEKGRPHKQDYRRFRIKEVKFADDYAMLQEVTERRYKKLIQEGGKLPDLILVDGGKGQLAAVNYILKKLALEIPLFSLAKREEEIFRIGSSEPIILPTDSLSLLFMQRIRDEAHRFALAYHRRIRDKEVKASKLDIIPGIGEKRKKLLLRYFSSIEEIKKASITEISKVPGIGEKIAQRIKTILEVRK